MATKNDLELAKLLLSQRVLDEGGMRQALEQQGTWLRAGRVEPLAEVLYELGLVPRGALAALEGPGPEQTQPFRNYRIEGLLGEGGMSRVYAATYLPNGTPVALKVLLPIPALRGDYLERFQREARLLTRLEHAGIVAGYELLFEGGYHCFSMDLVDGATVLEVIERRGHFTNAESLSVTLQVAEALAYLHTQGLLHRDVKPSNVMVEASGRARLIDLGLVGRLKPPVPSSGATPPPTPAASAPPLDSPEQSGMTVGTVEYLSPEQARGRLDLDARADVYSLGVSLYHMVVGEVPFQGESDYEVMAKQIMSAMDSAKVKQRRISPEIHFLIAKMTAKDRDARFSNMAEVARAIRGYLPDGQVPLDLGAPPRVMPMAPPLRGRGTPIGLPVLSPQVPSVHPVVRPPASVPPVRPPTLAPIVAPVVAPIVAPIVAPVVAPLMKPTLPPSVAPVVRPILPPTVAPLRPAGAPAQPPALPPRQPQRPVAAPAPSMPPTVRPVSPPTATPVASPTAVPVVRPVAPRPVAPVLTPVRAVRPEVAAPTRSPVAAAKPAPAEAPAKPAATDGPQAPAPSPTPTKGQAPVPTKKRRTP